MQDLSISYFGIVLLTVNPVWLFFKFKKMPFRSDNPAAAAAQANLSSSEARSRFPRFSSSSSSGAF